MRIGITLPQFRSSAAPALAAARAAEGLGLDGVFVFDHVWAIGHPERPAHNVWPLLGAIAADTRRVHVGPMVARVSLLANAVLVHNIETVGRIAGDRLIAGLGIGDHLSRPENEAVDVAFPPVAERLADLAEVASSLRSIGITTWVGGRSEPIHRTAVAGADALNLWDVAPDRVAAVDDVAVTWGGPVPADVDAVSDLLGRLAEAGATWAVCAPPYAAGADPEPAVRIVCEAAAALR